MNDRNLALSSLFQDYFQAGNHLPDLTDFPAKPIQCAVFVAVIVLHIDDYKGTPWRKNLAL
jgi:hypothetical protein